MKTLQAPTLTGSDLTVSYLRALLAGNATSHVDSLQNAALMNTIRHGGALVCNLSGVPYDVTPSKENAQQLALRPLAVRVGSELRSCEGIKTFVLNWGWGAFQTALIEGQIRLDQTWESPAWR